MGRSAVRRLVSVALLAAGLAVAAPSMAVVDVDRPCAMRHHCVEAPVAMVGPCCCDLASHAPARAQAPVSGPVPYLQPVVGGASVLDVSLPGRLATHRPPILASELFTLFAVLRI